MKETRDEQREIGEDGVQEIVKTTSFIFLPLIRVMLEIFQFVMKITMN